MNNILKIAVAMIAGIGMFSSQAGAATRDVNCDKGQTIQAALDKGQGSAGPLVINVSGLCDENVWIDRDDVTIYGNNTATIRGTSDVQGTINVFNAHRIRIDAATITGPDVGIIVHGGTAVVTADISQNPVGGLWVIRNSWVALGNSTVSENGVGVFVQTSMFEANDSKIINNTQDGILSDIGANVIVRNAEITGNQRNGLSIRLHSVTELRDATEVSGNSPNGASIDQDSALRISTSDVIFNDDIICGDTESSFANEGGISTGSVSCTDFNQVAPPAP